MQVFVSILDLSELRHLPVRDPVLFFKVVLYNFDVIAVCSLRNCHASWSTRWNEECEHHRHQCRWISQKLTYYWLPYHNIWKYKNKISLFTRRDLSHCIHIDFDLTVQKMAERDLSSLSCVCICRQPPGYTPLPNGPPPPRTIFL